MFAQVAAMGQLLLKKKIRKEDLIDACYHKCATLPSEAKLDKWSEGLLPESQGQNLALAVL